VAVLCHPHPQHGGTMDNKVVLTLARAMVQLGYTSVRFNFRGVGGSEGSWDHGMGEVQDALAVIAAYQAAHQAVDQALVLGGFSFGGYVASQAAAQLPAAARAQRLVLVGPAVVNFEMAPVPEDTLVVHGERDDVVPLAAVFDWARPQALPVTVLPGAGHFFHGQLTALKHIVLRAFGSHTAS
jgi:alpha/beta superfamily hydrolase